MNRARLYLLLALVGTVLPYLFFGSYFLANGLAIMQFVSALFANGAVGGFTADLVISSVVFWIYMFSKPEGPRPGLFILFNLTVGLSCALPAYLYSLEKRVNEKIA
jgi:hypothetical protein